MRKDCCLYNLTIAAVFAYINSVLAVTILRTNRKGGIYVGKTLITMTSITYAMKAKAILNNKKIYCEIEKTPKNIGSGCGYSIRIKDNTNYIIKILDENNIPYKDSFQLY